VFAAHVLGMMVSVMDLKSGVVQRTIPLPAEPYTCLCLPTDRPCSCRCGAEPGS
jgi:hypothetical protein